MNGAGTFGTDEDSAMSYTTPVLLRALLLSLVEDAGTAPGDIAVYDACRIFPAHMMEFCSEGALAGVRFRCYDEGGPNDAVRARHLVGRRGGSGERGARLRIGGRLPDQPRKPQGA